MAKLLKIDAFTDVVCPWCHVGSVRLDKAIAADENNARALAALERTATARGR